MAGLNKKIKASSLLECIVASVIWLIVFVITLEILTRITLKGKDEGVNLSMEIACRECYREYSKGVQLPGSYMKSYDWGDVEMEIIIYREGIQKLTMLILPAKGAGRIKRVWLVEEKTVSEKSDES